MATEITVSAGYIPNFAIQGYTPAAGDTVTLLWKLTEDGLDDDGVPRMRGTGPAIACTVYAWDSVDARFENGVGAAMPAFSPALSEYDGPYVLYIPSFQIDPTSDWLRPRPGRYNVSFRTPDGTEKRWLDWQDIVVPVDPNPIRLIDISLYSKGGVSGWGYDEAYTKEEVDAKITAALGTVMTNPMTAIGDSIYGGAVVAGLATPTRLAAGTNGHFYKMAAGLPSWAALASGDITTALGFTPENAANKNQASGYAGLSAGSKVALAQLQEVLGLADMTDVAPGAVPTNGQFLKGDGSAWANAALASGDITGALGFTPENAANKNAASGYAGLSAGSKVALAQLQEVLALPDLTDVAPGAVPTNGQFLKGDGSAWANAALASGDITTALTFTPENAANKNAASGYAGLSAGSKVALAQLQEVLALPDLTDVAPGAVPTSGQFLKGNGTSWANAALAAADMSDFASTVEAMAAAAFNSLLFEVIKGTIQTVSASGTTAVAATTTIVLTTNDSGINPTDITLPSAASSVGRIIIVARTNANAASVHNVDADGTDLLHLSDGTTPATVALAIGNWAFFICIDAATWRVLGK